MSIYEINQWIDDIDTASAMLPELCELEGKAVMITGAAGLICSSVVDILIRYNETHECKIKILAAGRWPEEMQGRFGVYCDKDYFEFVKYDSVSSANTINAHADYIIHGASNAFPGLVMAEPVETMMGNFIGMNFLLQYAKEHGSKRLLYISSSEVYGKKESSEPFREGEYGYIDLLDSRNSYSVSKRAAETLCVSYAKEYGIESVIVRPGHVYGPTASPQDNRVSSAFAYSAARGEDIIMKSDGSQLRSYCYCLDCASAILKVLIKGENSHAYNISNCDSIISIKEMAQLLAETAGIKLTTQSPSSEEKKGFNPMSNSSLESKSLEALGWKGLFDAPTGFGHTVKILKQLI